MLGDVREIMMDDGEWWANGVREMMDVRGMMVE
jgi:hypothetical protein